MLKTLCTRREFLRVSALSAVLYPMLPAGLSLAEEKVVAKEGRFPVTVEVLCEGYRSEISASRRYRQFCRRALSDEFPNIAYTFAALAVSEEIHANNYSKILNDLGTMVHDEKPAISISDTKKNLEDAANREMEKINNTYPGFLKRLSAESYDKAIVNCMYSLKSHRQHEKEIRLIAKYAGVLFGAVSHEIEKRDLDFHVCKICGSTLDVRPDMPCEICNYPLSYYEKIPRPTNR
jgi:rubrerythrin